MKRQARMRMIERGVVEERPKLELPFWPAGDAPSPDPIWACCTIATNDLSPLKHSQDTGLSICG